MTNRYTTVPVSSVGKDNEEYMQGLGFESRKPQKKRYTTKKRKNSEN